MSFIRNLTATRAVAIMTALNFVALMFVFSTALKGSWAPGPGVRDLGGGFTTDTSTANTLSFKLNGTEFARWTSSGLVTPRLTAGTPGTHSLSSTLGHVIARGGVATNGQGIDMSTSNSAITTAVVQIPTGPSTLANAATGTLRLGNKNTTMAVRGTAGEAPFAASAISADNGYLTAISSRTGTAAVNISLGFTVPAGYGGQFEKGADPTTPAAGKEIIYNDNGTAVMSVINSAGTTRAM